MVAMVAAMFFDYELGKRYEYVWRLADGAPTNAQNEKTPLGAMGRPEINSAARAILARLPSACGVVDSG